MNRPLITHSCYTLITIGMFVWGSQWARSSKSTGGQSPAGNLQLGSGGQFESRGLSGLKSKRSLKGRTGYGTAGVVYRQTADETDSGVAGLAPDWPSLLNIKKGPLSKDQIEALVLAATKSRNPVERRQAFDRILEEIASDSFTVEQAMAIRSAMAENRANGEQWRLFDYAWGANDPAAAVAHIDEIAQQHRKGFTSNMLPGLASVDPQTAIGIVASIEDLRFRQHLTGRLIEGLVDNDPALATDYVMRLAENNDPNARQYMKRVAREVLNTSGLEGGMQWAEWLPEGPLQGAALIPIANEFASNDPQGAAKWAEGYLGENENGNHVSRIFGEVVREWGNWEEASQWVQSLPAGQGQLDALSAVYGFRGAREPQVAVQDIIAMPDSPDKNFAINGFISGLARQDGETAVIWAAEITDPGMRTEAIIRAGRQFYHQDQNAAAEWFGSADLPEGSWDRVIADPSEGK